MRDERSEPRECDSNLLFPDAIVWCSALSCKQRRPQMSQNEIYLQEFDQFEKLQTMRAQTPRTFQQFD